MITFDLHYHANVYRSTAPGRRRRLAQHRETIKINGVDFLASTEHGYKRPLDAYLHLRDALDDLPTQVLPGVEAVSEEGVDIIFLFRDEDDLRRGLKSLTPFEWSVWDSAALGTDLGAITIIPHPFTPGRSGIVTQAGTKGLSTLLKSCDYVEAHNGSSLLLSKAVASKRRRIQSFIKERREFERKVKYTYDLPKQFRPKGVGVVYSSDAHFPGQQMIFSATDADLTADFDWFEFLAGRVCFERHIGELMDPRHRDAIPHSYADFTQTAMCVLGEAIQKKFQNQYQSAKKATQKATRKASLRLAS